MSGAKKRRLHKIRVDELSGVDRPAQKGAQVVLLKRDDSSEEEIAKRTFTEVLDDLEIEESLRETYDHFWTLQDSFRQYVREVLADSEQYPDPKQSIREALPQFATAITEMVADAVGELESAVGSAEEESKTARYGKGAGVNKPSDKKTGNESPEEAELQKKYDEQSKELEVAKAYGKLNDAEKAHHDALPSDEAKSEFLNKSADERASILDEIQKSDAIVYTSEDGEVFRKSDDPRLVKMAKKSDEDRKAFRKQQAESDTLRLQKRASEDLGNLPGEEPAKIALLKAVEGIEDEKLRDEAGAILKAHNEAHAGAFDKRGTKEAPSSDKAGAVQKFDTLVKKYREENEGTSEEDAILAVSQTDEGKALYEETLS